MSTAMPPSTEWDGATFKSILDTQSNEPVSFSERRRAAWEAFEEARWPNQRDEEWMRTDIRLFKLGKFSPLAESDAQPGAEALLSHGVELGGQVESVNGRAIASRLDEDLAAKGVVFGSLSDLAVSHADLVNDLMDLEVISPTYDRFSMLNSACWTGGTVLFVPKGVHILKPLHSLARLSGDGASDISKTIIVLEEGADATLLAETMSDDPSTAGFHCGSIEIVVGPGAHLRYVNLQNWNDRVWHFAHQRAVVEKEGQIQWTLGALGSRLAKVNQQVVLAGSDSTAQVNGAMFTQGKQHLSYNTHQHHEAPYCHSDLLYKSALQDVSRTVWRGMIKVDEPAQRTNAYQRNDNLMLASSARADSIPGLEIEADDVRCTHGSTSGKVDAEQIYYAMTRGYTRQEAVRMIVTGFFQQVFDRITIESVREALGEAIGRRVQDLSGE